MEWNRSDGNLFKLKCTFWVNLSIWKFWSLNVAFDQFGPSARVNGSAGYSVHYIWNTQQLNTNALLIISAVKLSATKRKKLTLNSVPKRSTDSVKSGIYSVVLSSACNRLQVPIPVRTQHLCSNYMEAMLLQKTWVQTDPTPDNTSALHRRRTITINQIS